MTQQQQEETNELFMSEWLAATQAGLLPTTKRPTIVWSNAKATGGTCYGNGRIIMSAQAFDEHGLAESLDTWRHEMAHLVHMNHSWRFWELAWRLGVQHTTAHSAASPKSGRYKYVCPRGHEVFTNGLRTRQYSCQHCSPRWDRRYILELVEDRKYDNITEGAAQDEIRRIEREIAKLTRR